MSLAFSAADRDDALREVINVGMGAAGAALAEALGVFVRLTIPQVKRLQAAEVIGELTRPPWENRRVSASSHAFYGGLSGDALAIFEENEAGQVADLLGHEGGIVGEATAEVVLELGHLMTGACVNGIADRLREIISFAPPTMVCEGVTLRSALSSSDFPWNQTLLVRIEFLIEERGFESRVILLISEKALPELDQAIERLLTELMS